MINEFEKNILEKIDFVSRYIASRNKNVALDRDRPFIKTRRIKILLKEINTAFTSLGNNIHKYDKEIGGYTFRLLFDIKHDSILTYIFVLKNEKFLDNGLSNLGFALHDFDISHYEIKQPFGIFDESHFTEYIKDMKSIYESFVEEYIKQTPELTEFPTLSEE